MVFFNIYLYNYERIYEEIIKNSINRVLVGYFEKHHILPKCMGGLNDKSNIVKLTAKEHFICHKLLCEIYKENNKLKYAYWLMCNTKNSYQIRNYKISSREYNRLKSELSIIRSKETNNRLGIKHTEESINKIKIARANQIFSKETRIKLSEKRKSKPGNKNFKHTDESKKKMSEKISETKGVKCIINDIKFNSISSAAKWFNIDPNKLRYKISLSENNKIILNNDKIKINELEFETFYDASLYFNIPITTLKYRIKNNIPLDKNVIYYDYFIDNIKYSSISNIVKETGIPSSTILNRISSDKFINYLKIEKLNFYFIFFSSSLLLISIT